jgi:hypothetical protein
MVFLNYCALDGTGVPTPVPFSKGAAPLPVRNIFIDLTEHWK